jgi:regulator of protease activity HflC (stomatin/prohibitin superfamily)
MELSAVTWAWVGGVAFFVLVVLPSIRVIGPTEVGLVVKRFSWSKLTKDQPIAFRGEAGFQGDLLMPGFRFKLWLVYRVAKFPWVQVPPGEIGVVIAQVGAPMPIGAKSAVYKPEFGNFSNLQAFLAAGGQKGVQRPVLPPGALLPMHPVAFLVITKGEVCGVPISPDLRSRADRSGRLSPASFGLRPEQLELVRISPHSGHDGGIVDMVGIVTTFEGDPLPSGDIASRLGGFADLSDMERQGAADPEVIERILGSKNNLHNNYQDLQAFLDHGGKIGLQHDPLLYGAYTLNPFLVSVELVPMLVVQQGQVAVIKAYVGLVSTDTSGAEFKFGSLVRPGHRGIWREPLRTGKYPINPHCYQAEIVPTAILTLNWAEASSEAHNLDRQLKQIVAKSKEGFVFSIDLQVQIHVPDTQAPRVISMVGTMQNLVNEVLQAAVGNHFRDKLQSMRAVEFIETRQQVQQQAFAYIKAQIDQYDVETRGVYIQDVIFPQDLVVVLTQREIANQEVQTFQKQRDAQNQRIEMEQSKGTADMQAELARARVGVDIQTNRAQARKAEADGEATYIRETGMAKGAEVEAVGLARAKAYREQVQALGQTPTAVVNAINALAEKNVKIVPDILVAGGGGSLDGLAGTLMSYLRSGGSGQAPAHVPAAAAEQEPPAAMTP